MMQGTTPTHYFYLPFGSEITGMLDEVHIIYSQKGSVILTKTKSDCQIDDDVISVALSQEDTFAFDSKEHVEIQLRLLIGKTCIGCIVEKIGVAKCLETEVLSCE